MQIIKLSFFSFTFNVTQSLFTVSAKSNSDAISFTQATPSLGRHRMRGKEKKRVFNLEKIIKKCNAPENLM